MKTLLTTLLFFSASSTIAQFKQTFYDADWKPCDEPVARFVSYVKKTDSGWLQLDYYLGTRQLQMHSLFEDEKCTIRKSNALWYHTNGKVATWCIYKNNQLHGSYYRFYSNGILRDSAYYENGKQVGVRLSYHRNGMISDSTNMLNDSTMVSVSWFENGNLSSAGYILNGKKQARWKYYHNNGTLACIEEYEKGKIINVAYFDINGNPDKLGIDNTDAEFKGGMKAWQKKVENKLYWPNGLQFSNGNMAVVVVEMMIDEKGEIAHAEVVVPLHKDFDKIALNAVRDAGSWAPAVSKNRNVVSWVRQKIRFTQTD